MRDGLVCFDLKTDKGGLVGTYTWASVCSKEFGLLFQLYYKNAIIEGLRNWDVELVGSGTTNLLE